MPNRMLRDWTGSDKMEQVSAFTERFFTRLIMKVDDYGCFYADVRLLKANLFPLLLDRVREADISCWMAECQKTGLIALYESNGKKYLQIQDFRQRLDKAKSKFPLPSDSTDFRELVNDSVGELELEVETETEQKTKKKISPKGDSKADALPTTLESDYKKLEKNKKSIVDFIRDQKPQFIEPYVDIWNIFAKENAVPAISKITNSRIRKFKVRIQDKSFDFVKILSQAKKSEFVRTGKWFGFDWVIENETNYLKILEGNFIQGNEATADPDKPVAKTFNQTLSYLYGRHKEGELDSKLILPEYYDRMVSHGQLAVGSMEKFTGSIDDKKRAAIIELFKIKSSHERLEKA